MLTFDPISIDGTFLRGYLNFPWSFEETVARLITLSKQDPTAHTDEYKVSVEFSGTFKGEPFTLYDYKEDRELHIGGTNNTDVDNLKAALLDALEGVQPTPYTAKEHYDTEGQHQWP